MNAAREWDAATYDRVSGPQQRWGAAVLDRLHLDGDDVVLDAGCGTGRITEMLLQRLPRGRVIALDASVAMLEQATQNLAGFGRRVEFVQADLAEPLPLRQPVDAILSTATLHLVLDHDTLFKNLAAVLAPGGQLVAQCGGRGNLASVKQCLGPLGEAREHALTYATPEETRARLASAGFVDVETWLQPETAEFETVAEFEAFLATVVLRRYIAQLPAAERAGFVSDLAGRLPRRELDYMRLNIVAHRRAS